jgi:NADH-quinone oxidoreductase subunit J
VGQSLLHVNRGVGAGAVAAIAVFLGVAAAVLRAGPASGRPTPAPTTAALGRALLTEWVLPFEALAVLFVAAMLGALYLAREDD